MSTAMEHVSKMSEDRIKGRQTPVTYGNALGAQGELADEPITLEDASLMQSAEARTFGHTEREGAASIMQAAAQENIRRGLVKEDAHSVAAEEGVMAERIMVPGADIKAEYIGGQPVMASVSPTPTNPLLASIEAVTIGDALEAAAVGGGDRPVDQSDARAIQSAVVRATGHAPIAGGLAAIAQSAADLNTRCPTADKTTLADLLMDASIELEADKVVTQEDANKVLDAELRNSPTGVPQPGGVAAAVQAAADINEQLGIVEPSMSEHRRAFPKEDTPVGDESDRTQEETEASIEPPKQAEKLDLPEEESAATIPKEDKSVDDITKMMDNLESPTNGGVGDAADINEHLGIVEPSMSEHRRAFPKEDTPVGDESDRPQEETETSIEPPKQAEKLDLPKEESAATIPKEDKSVDDITKMMNNLEAPTNVPSITV